jgi:hypothetical protein
MKNLLMFGCILAAMAGFTSCEDDNNGNGGYEGVNYIYLTSQNGKTTIYETDEEPLVIDVMLTAALEKDLTLTFALTGTEGVVSIEGNPVTIKAGEKTGSFNVVSNNANVLEETANYTVALDASTVLPENVELKESLSFVVTPVIVEEQDPTDEKTALLNAYKEETGIDLTKYIGLVNVSTVITGTDPDSGEPLEPRTVNGKTLIELSESATAEAPVLNMTTNAMGIEDYMYQILRSVTVDNDDYWYGEYTMPCYAKLMTALNWNKTSDEVFSMSLDGITFGAEGAIEFLGQGLNQYEEEITIVPFDYSFTAYDRELAAIESGDFNPSEDPDWMYDATANPYYHLNCDDITEDWYEMDGNWIEASASVSETALTFTFCVYACSLDSDYTRIVATYTPNN